MLSPVLEIYVVWHPQDREGAAIAQDLADHFQGGAFATLLSGAVEVFVRSVGWAGDADAPRPFAWPGTAANSAGPAAAQFVAVVPVVGVELSRAVKQSGSAWLHYMGDLVSAQERDLAHVRLFPMRIGDLPSGPLAELLANNQYLAEADRNAAVNEPLPELRRRDLAQGIAQWVTPEPNERLRIFISHTKWQGTPQESVGDLINAVRQVLESGRIATFFDARELQPGANWNQALRESAASSALLAVRTDLYATREWCQREMLMAKVHGMSVVVLEALTEGETRGSFLMDHTPRIPVHRLPGGGWETAAILRAVNLLADAWLYRVLWLRQRELAQGSQLRNYWWAPQAPEPCTLAAWMPDLKAASHPGGDVRILHPDPPLASDELMVLQQIVTLAGQGTLDLTTPRLLAARGG